MNTIALGFVGTPRGGAPRDSHFTGSSNNPSKKGSMIAPARPGSSMKRNDTAPETKTHSSHEIGTFADSKHHVPPAPATSIYALPPSNDDPSMIERRCEYLELLGKRQTTLLSDQNEQIKKLEDKLALQSDDPSLLGWLQATVLKPTTEYHASDCECDAPSCNGQGQSVAGGTVVNIRYPMHELSHNGNSRVIMCRRNVDRVTGQMSISWIVVYSIEAGEAAIRHVADFALV